MPDKDGVEIYKRFYPWPTRFRIGDPVLVKEVTGMRWPDFVAALDDVDEDEAPDQVVLAGLIAVAFWQGNPQMSRDKARRSVEKIPVDEIEIIDSDEVEGDALPPAPTGAGNQSSTTTNGSGVSPEDPAKTETPQGSTSDAMSLSGSGSPGWHSQLQESLQA